MRRCPRALLAESGWAMMVIDLSMLLHEKGLAPNAGGYYDQSGWFVDAAHIAQTMLQRGEVYKKK